MVRHFAMEPTFYEEQYPSGDANHLKRSLTLDLGCGRQGPPARRPRLAPILSSPDMSMLKMGSPDLEKFIIQSGLVTTSATPTPGTHVLFPPAPTEEQEQYARGFVDALNELHHSSDSSSQGQPAHYTDLDRAAYPASLVKDEPQLVPSAASSPPLSPIDMECQERIKLERKRQRNRVAASKCRRRKLERISRLEEKVKLLKGENAELSAVVLRLKEHVCRLKEQVMEHVQNGCQIVGGQF